MRRPSLVVGMPVYRRAWILDEWFDSLEAQDLPGDAHLLFGLTPSDDGTEQIIGRRAPRAEVIEIDWLPSFADAERDAPGRYSVLATIRNVLLRRVACLAPNAYLSWDSDIVLAPDALWHLSKVLDNPVLDVGAVGALVDMGGDERPGYWSFLEIIDGEPYRLPSRTAAALCAAARPFRTDVICGTKLMGPRAYRDARYADHIWGEDVGWAIQCAAMGVSLWLAPQARGEHRYRPSALGSPATTSRSSSR